MTDGYPRTFADERGVWMETKPGRPFGIKWGEIYSVCGYKLDGITEVYTVGELDFVYGHFLELQADLPGFSDVALAITERLPGISAGWLAEIEALGPRQDPLIVWRSAEPEPTADRSRT